MIFRAKDSEHRTIIIVTVTSRPILDTNLNEDFIVIILV